VLFGILFNFFFRKKQFGSRNMNLALFTKPLIAKNTAQCSQSGGGGQGMFKKHKEINSTQQEEWLVKVLEPKMHETIPVTGRGGL
jgi:hypothetical protein